MTLQSNEHFKSVRTYEPDNSLKQGYSSLFQEIIGEIVSNRWLIFQLFRRDFLSLYKQSLLGIFWAVFLPVISMGTFLILHNSGVLAVGSMNVPYPLFAILGLSFWQIFASGLMASSNALSLAGPMITKINFSKKSLVIASVGQAMVSFSIQLIFVCALLLYYRVPFYGRFLLVPLFCIPVTLLTLGAGFLFSLINGVMRDVGNLLSSAITFCMFLTPVLYVRPSSGFLAAITKYNILYYVVSFPRDFILTGETDGWRGFIVASALSCCIFWFCLIVFHLTETRVAERI